MARPRLLLVGPAATQLGPAFAATGQWSVHGSVDDLHGHASTYMQSDEPSTFVVAVKDDPTMLNRHPSWSMYPIFCYTSQPKEKNAQRWDFDKPVELLNEVERCLEKRLAQSVFLDKLEALRAEAQRQQLNSIDTLFTHLTGGSLASLTFPTPTFFLHNCPPCGVAPVQKLVVASTLFFQPAVDAASASVIVYVVNKVDDVKPVPNAVFVVWSDLEEGVARKNQKLADKHFSHFAAACYRKAPITVTTAVLEDLLGRFWRSQTEAPVSKGIPKDLGKLAEEVEKAAQALHIHVPAASASFPAPSAPPAQLSGGAQGSGVFASARNATMAFFGGVTGLSAGGT